MRIRRCLLVACLAALSLAGTACGQSAADETAPTQATSVKLHEPRPGVYTAGQPAATDWPAIAARGVGTVINLKPAAEMHGRDEGREVRAAGMRYLVIPIADAADIDTSSARQLSIVLADADAPVLIHCASANRAGGLLAVSAAQEGMAPEAALELGRRAGMKSTETRVREVLELPPSD